MRQIIIYILGWNVLSLSTVAACSIVDLSRCTTSELCSYALESNARPSKFLDKIKLENIICQNEITNGHLVDQISGNISVQDKVETGLVSYGFSSRVAPGIFKNDSLIDRVQIKALASDGDVVAQFILSVGYQKGEFSEVDPAGALDWLLVSSDAGYPPAIYNLSKFYRFGIATEKNLPGSYRLLSSITSFQLPQALYDLGVAYRDGIGTEKNLLRARRKFENAWELKFPFAAHNLGVLHASSEFGDSTPQKAKKFFRHAAKRGVPRSKLYYLSMEIDFYITHRDNLKNPTKYILIQSIIETLLPLQDQPNDSSNVYINEFSNFYSLSTHIDKNFLLNEAELMLIPELEQRFVDRALNDIEKQAYKNMQSSLHSNEHENLDFNQSTAGTNPKWLKLFNYHLCHQGSELISDKYCENSDLNSK